MLRVSLLGNLGADPEQRYSSNGTKIVTFNVAVNQVRKGQQGEREEQTEWFRVRVTGPRVEFAERLMKGSRVLVGGRLQIDHFRGRDGAMKTGFDVWADELENVTSRPRPSEPEAEAEAAEAEPEPAIAAAGSARTRNGGTKASATANGAEQLEDLPF